MRLPGSHPITLNYSIRFEGLDAHDHLLEARPAGQSLEGISWALALTLNYGIRGKTTFSRDLNKSARILISPPERGSVLYHLNILVQENPFLALIAGGYAVNTVTPYINGLIHYTFNQAMAVTSEFTQEAKQFLDRLNGDDLNAITRRIEPPLTRAHSAIGRTAETITFKSSRTDLAVLDEDTKDNLRARPSGIFDTLDTNVTSFNVLTGNGRLFNPDTETTIPFSLHQSPRHGTATALISSMEQYSLNRKGLIRITAERVETRGERLTKYLVSSAEEIPPQDWIDGKDPLREKR